MTPERLQRISKTLQKRQNDLTVVLENIEDPHNISAILRTCDSVGIQDVYVINTLSSSKINYGNKSSSSANKWVTVHPYSQIETCIAELKKNYSCILCAYLGKENNSLYSLDLTQSTALVFGNEAQGISQTMLKASDGSFIIPQVGMVKSLNVSVACAVSLYEAFRQKNEHNQYSTSKLSLERQNLLLTQWRGY